MTQRREPCCELFWVGAAQNPMTWEHLHGPPPRSPDFSQWYSAVVGVLLR
jgi:hypothetical protein